MSAPRLDSLDEAWRELWTSLASLLRSYTAVHGLGSGREASVELSDQKISILRGTKWLSLSRNHALVTWTRENGESGLLEITDRGNLRGPNGEEAMDLAAEAWARELMHDHTTEPTR